MKSTHKIKRRVLAALICVGMSFSTGATSVLANGNLQSGVQGDALSGNKAAAGREATVNTEAEFLAALENPAIDEITMNGTILVNAPSGGNNALMIKRSVTILGGIAG